ncbi:Phosphate regulon transcriptional regulatory protein PhoB (SphR) [Fulvivirga imtechensis AK7]|uniref:Phosphate regulon transcriptional regulatory protein PhoB (SphR) n=1 Tax=Fulvivirga imtechensis AK7 TaxID=1237149 RepID=L8JLQ1_9BACT|nr:response regulator transcription factor [Fulvivirga imtechensis]ELR69856.1 Phosphate regulon transcriptional regulatory protein PhoB (SphR) [Fulvivirga imtechensis AK7]
MSTILIIEDEPAMRLGLKDNLEFEGYQVDWAGDGEEGLVKIQSANYDLVLLDVMLPKLSGFDVCKKVRKQGLQTPIILLTAKGEEIDKVLGLEFGADDYVTKPFSVRELMARIKAILRRSQATGSNHGESISIGKVTVDFNNYTAKEGEEYVKMSHKEFEVLHYLYSHKNELVSRYDLLEDVWGYEEKPTTRTVDNFIVRLRQKIESNPNSPKIIMTVHGAGYKLIY